MSNKFRRIAAWVGIALLLGLYIATFVCAMLSTPGSGAMFAICLYASFVIPAVIFVLDRIYKYVHRNNAIDKTKANEMLKKSKEDKE